MDRSYNWKLCK